VLDIADRRNELSGNLSLYQELHGIEVIDRLLAEGVLVGSRYKHITVRVLEFARPPSTRLLGSTSKLNRDARFLKELMTQGERQAEEFLATLGFESAWRAKDIEAVLGHLAPDVQLTAAGSFAGVDGDARTRIAELCRTAAMDLTRKQLTRDRAVWDVRLPEGRGRIEAEIVDGKVTRLGFS
jgi:NTE family protein